MTVALTIIVILEFITLMSVVALAKKYKANNEFINERLIEISKENMKLKHDLLHGNRHEKK